MKTNKRTNKAKQKKRKGGIYTAKGRYIYGLVSGIPQPGAYRIRLKMLASNSEYLLTTKLKCGVPMHQFFLRQI